MTKSTFGTKIELPLEVQLPLKVMAAAKGKGGIRELLVEWILERLAKEDKAFETKIEESPLGIKEISLKNNKAFEEYLIDLCDKLGIKLELIAAQREEKKGYEARLARRLLAPKGRYYERPILLGIHDDKQGDDNLAGSHFEVNKKFEEAVEGYREAMKLNPNDAKSLESSAINLDIQRNPQKAREFWERALKIETRPEWVERIKKRLAEPD